PDFDKARTSFEQVAACVQRADEVVESVRGMVAKTDRAGVALNINEIIRETIALVRGDLEAAGIVVQLELTAQVPLISAHRGELHCRYKRRRRDARGHGSGAATNCEVRPRSG